MVDIPEIPLDEVGSSPQQTAPRRAVVEDYFGEDEDEMGEVF